METRTQDYFTSPESGAASEKSDAHFVRVGDAFKNRGNSVLAWSKAHGWAHQTVYQVIERWIEDPTRRGRMPLGGISRQVILALHDELGSELVPLPSLADACSPAERRRAERRHGKGRRAAERAA